MDKHICTDCASILCDCGAYHGTDGHVETDSDRGPLYLFQQTREQVDNGDEPCDRVAQYALCDDEVDRVESDCSSCDCDEI